MRSVGAVPGVVTAVIGLAGAFEVAPADPTEAEVRDYLTSRLDESGAPSISVAVAVDGEVVLATAVGYADVENQVLATTETRYRIYSITRGITAIAVLQLWEDGRVALDEGIRRHVPGLPASYEPVQLIHLLTHTSGVRHYEEGSGEISSEVEYASLDEAIGIFKDDPLGFAPGTGYRYTSFGFNLLAGVVEAVSGGSLETYLADEIFAPAGMSASVLHTRDRSEPALADPYHLRGWWRFRSLKRVSRPPNLSARYASGGIVSTPVDLVRMMIALDEGRLLRTDTRRRMLTVPFPDLRETQALGWNVAASADGGSVVYRTGGGIGYTGILVHHPRVRVTGAVLVNMAEFPGRVELIEWLLGPYLGTDGSEADEEGD